MKKAFPFVLIFTLLFSMSCSKKQIVKKYFILDTAEEMENNGRFENLPYSVQIRPFQISTAYNQMRIALRTRSNELNYFYYNSWAENPQSAIRFFLWKKIKHASFLKKCDLQIGETNPDYIITGMIEQIERAVKENIHSAHLKMTLELIDVRSDEVLFTHSFDRYLPFKENATMNVFASSLSQILDEESTIIIEKIYNKLK